MKNEKEITVCGEKEDYSFNELALAFEAQRRENERWREAAQVLSCFTPEELEVRLDAMLKCMGGLTVANQQYKDKLDKAASRYEVAINILETIIAGFTDEKKALK